MDESPQKEIGKEINLQFKTTFNRNDKKHGIIIWIVTPDCCRFSPTVLSFKDSGISSPQANHQEKLLLHPLSPDVPILSNLHSFCHPTITLHQQPLTKSSESFARKAIPLGSLAPASTKQGSVLFFCMSQHIHQNSNKDIIKDP